MKGDRLEIRNCPDLLAQLPEETEPKIRLKLAFLVCFSRIGMDLEVLCESFGIATPTGYEWIRTWNQKGYEGLLESGSRPGRPPRLDDFDLSYLASLLRQKQGWTTLEVAELIQSTFGIQYSPVHVARMLRKRLKMCFGKPFVHDHRRPEEAEDLLAERLTETFKALKEQNIPRHAIALGFVDETSPQNRANTVRLWSFEPSPMLVRNTAHFKANTIGFYALKGQSVQDFMPDSTAESIQKFLRTIKAANAECQAIVIVWDNYSSHKAEATQAEAARLGIHLVSLPRYSPDLNPEEYLWKSLKRKVCKAFINDVDEMKAVIQAGWNELSRNMGFARYWVEDFLGPDSAYADLCF